MKSPFCPVPLLPVIVASLATVVSCGPGVGGGTITVGGPASNGDVTRSDQAQPSGWAAPISADTWHLDLTADNAVTILMCATNPNAGFDPYLQLDFNGTQVAMDDDSAGNLNARIVYTPTQSGGYLLYALARGGTAPGSSGTYTLRVMQGAMFDASCPTTGGP